ncbi:hypothetical protein Tco_1474351 [Tanacetum coccineum]
MESIKCRFRGTDEERPDPVTLNMQRHSSNRFKNSSSRSYSRTRRQKRQKLSPTYWTMGQRTSILLAEETLVEEELCTVYDTDNEEEESMPIYDTDIEDVIEEEE